uniref:Uncharacterized protein n=1 Tax=Oryza meridionalis TaxID=40149 RepID=A0A0E0D9M7_9ORYZ
MRELAGNPWTWSGLSLQVDQPVFADWGFSGDGQLVFATAVERAAPAKSPPRPAARITLCRGPPSAIHVR